MKNLNRLLWTLVFGFILMNIVAFFHAFKFTHFAENIRVKTKSPEKLGALAKLKTLFFGVNNPRPLNTFTPQKNYETVKLQSHKQIEGWYIKSDSSLGEVKGTIIIFHGYSGNKSQMIDHADEFLAMGYNTFLIDFMGSGGSEGNQTTIGFKESEDVKVAYEYIGNQGEQNIYLFGTSMGAVAIMKAINDYSIDPKAIILECPFGSMYKTTCARFEIMDAPSFPLAGILLFWGGIQNDISPFSHKPTEYAKKISCSTLLLHGAKDENVSRQEIDVIYKNLKGKKKLRIFPEAAHESYLFNYKNVWKEEIELFLSKD